ncbi:probable RNA-directed DNA polymerase from transposon X-element [Trichonephila clavipes]|nr:probable RNA-directed DNA polymerase from transposon X-element [Trichonephila clavipes]
MLNLNITFPSTPTRFGHNSANTIDIALIKNFYYPFTINSIDDISSDHNPVFLNFNFKLAVEPPNSRVVSTDWNVFKTNLNKNLSLFYFHPNSINSTNDLEQKITEFTEAVIDTHSHASRPIETDRRNFTPHHINQLLNETLFNEHSVSAGCPQGSLLGPLLFNLYINDIPDYSLTKMNLYADNTAIHATYKKLSTISYAINKHLLHLQNFYDKWKISINVEKSTAIIFTKKLSLPPPIIMCNKQIPWSQEAKYLGIIFDTHLTWKQHILYVHDKFRKIMFKLYPLIGLNSYLSIENKVLLYTAVMRPILAYASPVWGFMPLKLISIS